MAPHWWRWGPVQAFPFVHIGCPRQCLRFELGISPFLLQQSPNALGAKSGPHVAVGRCPPPRPPNFSTTQIFMSTIFCNCSAASTGRMIMNRICVGLGCAVALLLGVSSASAQGTVKIGLINVLSGQFADAGIQLDNGVKTYMKQHGDTVAGKTIEIIRRDV